jgi:hypothetical protein
MCFADIRTHFHLESIMISISVSTRSVPGVEKHYDTLEVLMRI